MVEQKKKTIRRKGYSVMNVTICDDNCSFAQLLQGRIKDYFALIDRTCIVEIYSDPQKMLEAQNQYNNIKETLDKTMEEWMEVHKRSLERDPKYMRYYKYYVQCTDGTLRIEDD